MECPVHTDQTVIMVCRSQECDSTFICVHCIAGPHNGHKMTTLEETGKDARERLKDMSAANIEFIKDKEKILQRIMFIEQEIDQKQKTARKFLETNGQQILDTVKKVINDNMTSFPWDMQYTQQQKELNDIKRVARDAIDTVKNSLKRLEQVLETEDWIKIIMKKMDAMPVPKLDDLPEYTIPDIEIEEINKALVTEIKSALLPCTSPLTEADEATSDFQGSVYRHKSLTSVSCITLSEDHAVRCVAPDNQDRFWAIIDKAIWLCNKKGIYHEVGMKFRGVAISENDKSLVVCTDDNRVLKITTNGKTLHHFKSGPLKPNKLCLASNGDILVTLISSTARVSAGAVSRYTPQGERMITFERDRFGNSICPKYVTASRVSDMVVVTNLTNYGNDDWVYDHVLVMTGDLQVKFRYLSDGRVIPGDQKYQQDVSSKHFVPAIDSKDHVILGDIKSGYIEIIDKHGHKLQCLGQVDELSYLAVSIDGQLWTGKETGQVEVFKLT